MTLDGASKTGGRAARSAPVRVGVVSLGCAKNLVDTEVMLGHLDRAGYEFVQDPQEADVILVNTCGFIESAREESVRAILEATELKTNGRRVQRLVVAGCMVQRYREELSRSLPEVDAFLGLDELDRVVDRVALKPGPRATVGTLADPRLPVVTSDRQNVRPAAGALATRGASRYLYDHTTPRRTATPAWTAYIKIAEGCDHTCAFCAIPSFRGSFRSRSVESIVAEAKHLARQGVSEINLIAQDSSHYGRDLGIVDGLAQLLRALDTIEGLRWIRVHYLYPNTITRELIESMRDASHILPYVDIPLQHADPATLKRMRRGGSAETHETLLDRFRTAMPDVTLRSTFIVGFPGETEAEFASLLEFVRRQRFHHVGVFTYSHEEGTPAHALVDDVAETVKQDRRDRLMACQQRIVFERNSEMIGQRVTVLVEGAHPETDDLMVGRTAAQSPDVDGQVLINDGVASPGTYAIVEITETAGYDLVGRAVDPA